jgi:hypothetical protein
MKEDILEQLVDDYLMLQGYFTRHNLRFKPAKEHPEFKKQEDAVASDIDVVGIHPLRSGPERVVAVSCKSWQYGFDPRAMLAAIDGNKIVAGKEAWKAFRELCQPKWSEAFVEAVYDATGTREFTYHLAVTALRNPDGIAAWETNERFSKAINGNPIRILTLEKMLNEVWAKLTHTPASSGIGRILQLTKAANWKAPG